MRSFDKNERELHIEVKTTEFGINMPFFLSRNELRHSKEHEVNARLYRVFQINRKTGLYILKGAFDSTLELEPVNFQATRIRN